MQKKNRSNINNQNFITSIDLITHMSPCLFSHAIERKNGKSKLAYARKLKQMLLIFLHANDKKKSQRVSKFISSKHSFLFII
jgi:hypothetical protein